MVELTLEGHKRLFLADLKCFKDKEDAWYEETVKAVNAAKNRGELIQAMIDHSPKIEVRR